MYAEAQQQYRISPPSRKFLIALLLSAVSHAVAITLVHPSATPTPAIAPLRVVLTSAPPLAIRAPAAGPERTAPTPDPLPEPAAKSEPPPAPVANPEPPPDPVVKPQVRPKPAAKPVKKRITQAPKPRPKRLITPSPVKPSRPTPPQSTVVAALAATSPRPAATATAESRKVEYLYNPPPDYPPRARRLGLEGEVLIRTRVLLNGESDQLMLKRSSGYALLDDAAMQAVRKWRFRPARRGTEEIVSWVEIPVRFRLER